MPLPSQYIGPAQNMIAISPMDSDLPLGVTRGLFINQGGDVYVEASDGSLAWFRNVPSNYFLPIQVNQVKVGTTATFIWALY